MSTFLGVGWACPIAVAPSGETALAADEEDIRQAIRIILGTAPGERMMRPDFGAGLNALVFEPINTTTMALAKHYVEQALIRWEARIDSVTVQVDADRSRGRLLIDIS